MMLYVETHNEVEYLVTFRTDVHNRRGELSATVRERILPGPRYWEGMTARHRRQLVNRAARRLELGSRAVGRFTTWEDSSGRTVSGLVYCYAMTE